MNSEEWPINSRRLGLQEPSRLLKFQTRQGRVTPYSSSSRQSPDLGHTPKKNCCLKTSKGCSPTCTSADYISSELFMHHNTKTLHITVTTISTFCKQMNGLAIRIRMIRDAFHASAVFPPKRAHQQSKQSKLRIFIKG